VPVLLSAGIAPLVPAGIVELVTKYSGWLKLSS